MKTKFTSSKGYIPADSVAQVSIIGEHVYLSGQIPWNPANNEYVRGGIVEQTTQVLDNIKGILKDLNMGLEHIVKCNVFISAMDDFAGMDKVYQSYFGTENPPARQTVTAEIWGGLLVEISAEAIKE